MMKRSSAPALYIAFALVGFCTALPGAALPALLTHWHLTDQRAGTLLLLLFLGSCVGSLVSTGKPAVLAPLGTTVLMTACFVLSLSHGLLVLGEFALYGFGFGMMIASITRLRLLQVPQRGVEEVNRLNLLWGVGALLRPSVATATLRKASIPTLLTVVGCLLALLVIAMLSSRVHDQRFGHVPREEQKSSLRLPFVFGLYTFLAVGAEAALGAWIATYSHRLVQGFFAPAEATTLFWFGLLASRLLAGSRVTRHLEHNRLMQISVSIAALGGALLLFAPTQAALLPAALFAGLGLGPIYPTLLAYVLPKTASNAIFFIGGITSSLLPWLTGTLSVHAGSLRIGLAVPAGATMLMLLLSAALSRRLARWRSAESTSW